MQTSNGRFTAAATACALALLACAPVLAQTDAARPPTVERHRMNLGGPSGQYTDWQRSGIEGFAGLRTTIEIQRTHGRARDTWSALARINVFGAARAGADAPMLSLLLEADRRSQAVAARILPVGAGEQRGLEFEGEVGRPIQVALHLQGEDRLSLAIDDSRFTIELPPGFRVDAVSAVGSGVDVRFDPFELLLRD